MHDPADGCALAEVGPDHLARCNFLDLPEANLLARQHDVLRQELGRHTEVVTLRDLLGDDTAYQNEARRNPNLMFTRDSTITLPWAPGIFIPGRLALADRKGETAVAGAALERLGLRPAFRFDGDEYCEGGDVLPVMHEGKRILLVGLGSRTTREAAFRLAKELIPHHVDQVIGLFHDHDLLHLDTGFTVLPRGVLYVATGMVQAGFVIDERRKLTMIDPATYARDLGLTVVACDKADAIEHERCNLLPLGGGRFVAFFMPEGARRKLERAAGISISCVDGHEIAKAAGGVHCLTRPVYA